MLIYKIVNKINKKIYIGETTKSLEKRQSDYLKETKYKKDPNRIIIRAMQKYGFENFEFIILKDNILTQEDLDKEERNYISKYNCCDKSKGYNMELGGEWNR